MLMLHSTMERHIIIKNYNTLLKMDNGKQLHVYIYIYRGTSPVRLFKYGQF